MKKLNQISPSPLVDIRFSTARWQPTKKNLFSNQIFHYRASQLFRKQFQLCWQESLVSPACPTCGSPTPQGELEPWGVCSICAARSF